MTDLNKIIDELSKLTVVEAAELSKQLEEKWGVTAAAPAPAAPAAAAPSPRWMLRECRDLVEVAIAFVSG